MILVKIDFNNRVHWFWFNKVTEGSYSIGNSNVSIDEIFYSDLFKILKQYRGNIDEAKNRILELINKYN